jgi:hypothetical protein
MPENNEIDERDENPNPLCHLRGTYATSYLGYIYMVPPAANPAGVPQIGAYQPKAGGVGFDQVSGYRLHTLAAYIDFDGGGNLHGSGYINRGGITPTPYNFTGTYTIIGGLPYTGTFELIDAGGGKVQYYWVMSDSWRRLEFMVLHGTPHNLVVAGTLTRV